MRKNITWLKQQPQCDYFENTHLSYKSFQLLVRQAIHSSHSTYSMPESKKRMYNHDNNTTTRFGFVLWLV
jgi:hypothetical protein